MTILSRRCRQRGFAIIPLAIFIVLLVLLGVGLTLRPTEVPSPLIGKPAPEFSVPSLFDLEKTVSDQDLKGQVSVVNVWGSWCIPCREEHPYVTALHETGKARVIGLNYKDKREDALAWLSRFGNSYDESGYDPDGKAGLDWGVYGVPETFILDKKGVIRYKHIGPIGPDSLNETILPLIDELRAEAP